MIRWAKLTRDRHILTTGWYGLGLILIIHGRGAGRARGYKPLTFSQFATARLMVGVEISDGLFVVRAHERDAANSAAGSV